MFRDTAHGLITWAVATIFVAAFLALSVSLASHVAVQADATTTDMGLDAARKAASEASLFTGFSMLIGAFIACAATALGGQRRDLHS